MFAIFVDVSPAEFEDSLTVEKQEQSAKRYPSLTLPKSCKNNYIQAWGQAVGLLCEMLELMPEK